MNDRSWVRRRRAAACLLSGALLLGALTGCAVSRNSDDIYEPVPTPEAVPTEETSAPTEAPTEAPDVTEAPDSTPEPTQEQPSVDASALFQKAVFIGNSCIDSLQLSGTIDGATYLARTGLNVGQPFTKSTNTGSIPIMDELNGKDYDRVFLLFGENELGWQSTSVFVDEYGEIIDGVRERLPNAQIYLLSIMPVTAAAHEKNQWMVNNDRIKEFNGLIKQLAEDKSATFIDLFAAMVNDSGVMPDDLSSDGIHPNAAACKVWADTMINQLGGKTE